jgi:hypothetical protein
MFRTLQAVFFLQAAKKFDKKMGKVCFSSVKLANFAI